MPGRCQLSRRITPGLAKVGEAAGIVATFQAKCAAARERCRRGSRRQDGLGRLQGRRIVGFHAGASSWAASRSLPRTKMCAGIGGNQNQGVIVVGQSLGNSRRAPRAGSRARSAHRPRRGRQALSAPTTAQAASRAAGSVCVEKHASLVFRLLRMSRSTSRRERRPRASRSMGLRPAPGRRRCRPPPARRA